jgi:hypothetical protein
MITLYQILQTIKMIKSSEMRFAEHVVRVGEVTNAQRILD